MDPNLILGGNATTGALPSGDVEALRKALEAGYGTDMSTLSGGAALRVQSLDRTMQAVIQENEHFKLFNRLAKASVGATVDEWTEQNGIGGFVGGTTNTESGSIVESTGTYNRRVGQVKYLMTRRSVSFVQTLQTAIAESEATEYANGALELLTNAEHLSFEGDSAVVPTEFDGIYAQMVAGVASGAVDGASIVDMQASAWTGIDPIAAIAAQVAGFGNFGRSTDVFLSQLAQADLDISLDPAFRVPLTDMGSGGISLGAPVVGIRTSWGPIKTNPDIFVRDETQKTPFELRYPSLATANVGLQPAACTLAVTTDVVSKFGAVAAGNYYYLVAGVNAAGQSTGLITVQQAVAAGQRCTLTITKSAAGNETGYVIYRSRKNGTNAVSDFREMLRIPRTGTTTTYIDQNTEIPGTTKAFVLNLTPSATAINWRQLLPMMKFALYPTVSATVPWAQLLFGYLRISKRRHHAVIKNILPNKATWRPFG